MAFFEGGEVEGTLVPVLVKKLRHRECARLSPEYGFRRNLPNGEASPKSRANNGLKRVQFVQKPVDILCCSQVVRLDQRQSFPTT